MSSTPFYMFGLIFFGLIALFLPDFTAYSLNYVKANHIAEAIIESGQKNGGIDQAIVDQILDDRNISSDNWSIIYTENLVDFNEPMTVQISGSYKIKALNIISKAFGDSINTNLPINIQRETVGQVYRR